MEIVSHCQCLNEVKYNILYTLVLDPTRIDCSKEVTIIRHDIGTRASTVYDSAKKFRDVSRDVPSLGDSDCLNIACLWLA